MARIKNSVIIEDSIIHPYIIKMSSGDGAGFVIYKKITRKDAKTPEKFMKTTSSLPGAVEWIMTKKLSENKRVFILQDFIEMYKKYRKELYEKVSIEYDIDVVKNLRDKVSNLEERLSKLEKNS